MNNNEDYGQETIMFQLAALFTDIDWRRVRVRAITSAEWVKLTQVVADLEAIREKYKNTTEERS